MFSGTYDGLVASQDSITGKYLRGEREIPLPERRKHAAKHIHIKGASMHNIDRLDVDIPLYSFVCITGVSGSGKSTLVYDVLYEALKEHESSSPVMDSRQDISISTNHANSITFDYFPESVEIIDQSAVGRISRSNVATYSGVFDPIRSLFANTPLSRERGLSASYFSFNVEWGGRCEACQGDGQRRIEMSRRVERGR